MVTGKRLLLENLRGDTCSDDLCFPSHFTSMTLDFFSEIDSEKSKCSLRRHHQQDWHGTERMNDFPQFPPKNWPYDFCVKNYTSSITE
ncbi:Fibrinogen Alpha Chain [Manis pentadactyla]|nr:Fibrinogen Alpha Chain [Manis pentadactyla]